MSLHRDTVWIACEIFSGCMCCVTAVTTDIVLYNMHWIGLDVVEKLWGVKGGAHDQKAKLVALWCFFKLFIDVSSTDKSKWWKCEKISGISFKARGCLCQWRVWYCA